MGTWQLDPYHTQVEFSAKHLGMMTVRGHFAEVSATGDIHPDRPEASSVQATISTASIRTNHEVRDNDLRTSNFLDVENYPIMTFTSTSIEPAGEDQYKVTGDLTIKGTTHSVTLDSEHVNSKGNDFGNHPTTTVTRSPRARPRGTRPRASS